jgi:hypothetical protein
VRRKALAAFGRTIDVAWQLNQRMDPHSTTDEIEALLARVRPHIWGAKLGTVPISVAGGHKNGTVPLRTTD